MNVEPRLGSRVEIMNLKTDDAHADLELTLFVFLRKLNKPKSCVFLTKYPDAALTRILVNTPGYFRGINNRNRTILADHFYFVKLTKHLVN